MVKNQLKSIYYLTLLTWLVFQNVHAHSLKRFWSPSYLQFDSVDTDQIYPLMKLCQKLLKDKKSYVSYAEINELLNLLKSTIVMEKKINPEYWLLRQG